MKIIIQKKNIQRKELQFDGNSSSHPQGFSAQNNLH